MSQFVFGLTDDRAHLLAVSLRELDNKFFQYSVVAFEQAITPALKVVETLVVLARRGINLIDQSKNFVDRLIAHQLADEHQMALARNMRRRRRRRKNQPWWQSAKKRRHDNQSEAACPAWSLGGPTENRI